MLSFLVLVLSVSLAAGEFLLCDPSGYCSTPPSAFLLTLDGYDAHEERNFSSPFGNAVFYRPPFDQGQDIRQFELVYCTTTTNIPCVLVPSCETGPVPFSQPSHSLDHYCWTAAPNYAVYVVALTVLLALSLVAHGIVLWQLRKLSRKDTLKAEKLPLLQ
jgi:hypothetical protein